MKRDFFDIHREVAAVEMSGLIKLAQNLLAKGPHKLEKTSRRVRALYDNLYIFDTTEAQHVWEHPYYPQFCVPSSAIKDGLLTKDEAIDDNKSAFLATLKGENRSTDRVLTFEKGPLSGLVRFEFSALDQWFEEDQPIYVHPKDPYKRLDILPSTRTITAKVDGVTVAESSSNLFLFETSLRTRYYMPQTSVRWDYLTQSDTTTLCPYKGMANYYNVVVDGREYKDLIWWYKTPTLESAPIVGHICFYNEKVDMFIDGVKEEHAVQLWPIVFGEAPPDPMELTKPFSRIAIKAFARHGVAITPGKTPITVAKSYPSTREIPQTRHLHLSPLHRAQAFASLRNIHSAASRRAPPELVQAVDESPLHPPDPSNPALSFPCLDAQEAKTASLSRRTLSSGPEPSYTTGIHRNWHSQDALLLDWGGVLPKFTIAYENWGQLNEAKSNAILLHTGLSASSHAHSTEENSKPGWWERFIGPGAPLDTNKYFVICTNVIGSCYGSTGPSSLDPADGLNYATRFPILTMEDMVRAQFKLLDAFGIRKLYASVGSSMGGMQSLAAGVLFPQRVGKVVSVSGCARSHPYSIAMRHTQRQVLMMDPNWSRGFYYNKIPPHAGMKLAREIATVTYRSGPEWEQRFGRRRADPRRPPALCPDFLIETYLDHAGEKFCLEYDANSLLYVSKAMDLFDLGHKHQVQMSELRQQNSSRDSSGLKVQGEGRSCSLALPDKPYEEQAPESASQSLAEPVASTSSKPPEDLVAGLAPLRNHPTLVMGVASDNLFPAWQQREIAETLRATGNRSITHVELGEDTSLFGHDTFLLDLEHIGGSIKSFLS